MAEPSRRVFPGKDTSRDAGDYSPHPVATAPVETHPVPAQCAGLRADQALATMLPRFSRNRLSAWLREGRIRIDDRPVKPRDKVWGGEVVTVEALEVPGEAPPEAQAIPLPIVHEDDAVLVIDKPAGLVVHPGSGNWSGTMMNALLHHAPALAQVPRAGIVHRLDKDTSEIGRAHV